MGHGIQFATIRLIVITLVVTTQIYLFLRIWQAIRSSFRSNRFKSVATVMVGLAILLLFFANRYIALKPIPWADPPLEAQVILFYLPAVWGFASIFSALILFVIQIVAGMGRMVVRIFRSPISQSASAPVDLERRHLFQVGVGGLATAPFIISGYGAIFSSKAFKVRELTLTFGLPLRIIQLTDIHAGIYMRRQELRRLADQVIALQPDLLALTGDYISNSMEFLPSCVEEMARIRARYGTFASLGNHEHWYGEVNAIKAIFSQYNVPLLVNTHKLIHTEHGALAVAGIDDLRSGRPDLHAALNGLDSTVPTILLSHRPEIFPLAAANGIPLTLSGHYHGGQIKLNLPGGDISLATFMTSYPEGPYRIDRSHLYVSSGIGTTFTPIRLNDPPEITVLNLTV
jgi:hypothetical protein